MNKEQISIIEKHDNPQDLKSEILKRIKSEEFTNLIKNNDSGLLIFNGIKHCNKKEPFDSGITFGFGTLIEQFICINNLMEILEDHLNKIQEQINKEGGK